MKKLLILISLLMLAPSLHAESNKVMELSVTGMTCPFCAYGIEKNLKKLPGVKQAEVSLEKNKARVIMEPGQSPNEASIREAITNSGFTPGDARTYEAESK